MNIAMNSGRSTRSRNRRIILVIVLALVPVLACMGWCLFSALHVDPVYRASTYGVDDPNKAVLVIENNTTEFYILSTKLTDASGQVQDFGPIFMNSKGSFPIEPGDYTLEIEYSDHPSLEDLPSFSWYVHDFLRAQITPQKKRATIYSVEGGHAYGITYEPPELKKK